MAAEAAPAVAEVVLAAAAAPETVGEAVTQALAGAMLVRVAMPVVTAEAAVMPEEEEMPAGAVTARAAVMPEGAVMAQAAVMPAVRVQVASAALGSAELVWMRAQRRRFIAAMALEQAPVLPDMAPTDQAPVRALPDMPVSAVAPHPVTAMVLLRRNWARSTPRMPRHKPSRMPHRHLWLGNSRLTPAHSTPSLARIAPRLLPRRRRR